jgi:hypothetical protein
VSTGPDFGGVADKASTLSKAIHCEVATLGNQMDQLRICTERLQTHDDRRSRYHIVELEDSKTD